MVLCSLPHPSPGPGGRSPLGMISTLQKGGSQNREGLGSGWERGAGRTYVGIRFAQEILAKSLPSYEPCVAEGLRGLKKWTQHSLGIFRPPSCSRAPGALCWPRGSWPPSRALPQREKRKGKGVFGAVWETRPKLSELLIQQKRCSQKRSGFLMFVLVYACWLHVLP